MLDFFYFENIFTSYQNKNIIQDLLFLQSRFLKIENDF
jgi:hypothetical protein